MSGQNNEWPTVTVILGVMALVTALIIWGPPEIAGIVGFLALIFFIGVFG